ncbi:MAG: hypothetical protein ACR2JY_10460 [Chloroflexota bacterium]
MSSTSIVLVVIGVIVLLIGILRHFARLSFLSGMAHASTILIVIGAIILIAGILVGQSGRRSVV